MEKKISLCIVAHNAYGVLANVDTGHAGGIEVQTPLMAKWFASQPEFDVSMITWDEGYTDGEIIDGVKVFKMCKRDDGFPILRFFMPRWSSLVAALNRADPDIVYYNCGDLALGQVAIWAKSKGRKVVYSTAQEVDCMKKLPKLQPLREKVLYRHGLRNSDTIVTQTKKQEKLLFSEFGLQSITIPMPSEGVSVERKKQPSDPMHVLWVGRFAYPKRLEWLLDLAEVCPGFIFDVVGDANFPTEYSTGLIDRAKTIKNVVLHGRAPHKDMYKFYEQADVICSTSVFEGFPNVFLEAWSAGLPIVSTFDPDDVIKTYGIGYVATDVNDLKEKLNALMDAAQWQKSSEAAYHYFSNTHSLSNCMGKFKQAFLDLM